jgi:hypothetical protein
MSMGGSSNDWELHSQLSAIQRVASKAIQEGNSVNLANIDTAFDKKTPPPKVIKDEFGAKSEAKISYDKPAAEFTTKTESSFTSLDPFQKTNRDYQTLNPEDIAKRGDVLKSLGILETERSGDDVFSVADSGVYARGEANGAEFPSKQTQDTPEKLDQEHLIKQLFHDLGDA